MEYTTSRPLPLQAMTKERLLWTLTIYLRGAYSAVLETAEKFHPDLTLQFGLLSSHCDNDDDFLSQAEALIKYWLAKMIGDMSLKTFFTIRLVIPSFKGFFKAY